MHLSWGALTWSIPSYLTLLGNTLILLPPICNLLFAWDVNKVKVIEWQKSKYLKSLLSTAKYTRHVARTETLIAFIMSRQYHFFFNNESVRAQKTLHDINFLYSLVDLFDYIWLIDFTVRVLFYFTFCLVDWKSFFVITVKVRNELSFYLQTYTFPSFSNWILPLVDFFFVLTSFNFLFAIWVLFYRPVLMVFTLSSANFTNASELSKKLSK